MATTDFFNRTYSRRGFIGIGAAAVASIALAGCSQGGSSDSSTGSEGSSGAAAAPDKIIIACLAREEPDIRWLADKLAGTYTIEPQVFGDNNAINEATYDGSVAANYFQNRKYLEAWNESKGTDLEFYGDPVFYTRDILVSRKYKSIDDFEDGAIVLIANDNTNRARELKLLEKAGLIKLNPDAELPSVFDITENPKNLDIKEVDPRSRVGAFPDADAMVAPSITVFQMNDPEVTVDSALAAEEPEAFTQYGGTGLVIKPENESWEWLDAALEQFESQEFADFLKETYAGAKVPASEVK